MEDGKNKKNNPCWGKDKSKDCGPKNEPPLIKLPNKKQFNFSIWFFVILLFAIILINYLVEGYAERISVESIEYSDFKDKIKSGEIKVVEIGDKKIQGFSFDPNQLNAKSLGDLKNKNLDKTYKAYKTVPVNDPQLVPLLDEYKVKYYATPVQNNALFNFVISWILPFLIFFLIWRFLVKRLGNLGSNVMAFGQNKSQIVAEGSVNVKFDDVAGADEAKEELIEVVDFLKNPEKYRAIGGRIPKGVLLVGPPGGGKTLMARAVAGEAGVTFFKISGADFVELFVGVGAARVRDLFKQAREKAPCIIFIDELDAIGKSRVNMLSSNDEREQTLNQLLVEMDGFDSTNGVILLGATNRPEVLDSALLRPGRFDRQVVMDRPDLIGREAILKIHAKNVKLDKTVDLKKVANATVGFVGADLANIVNEAALLAVRAGRKLVFMEDFDEVIEKVIAGLRKKNRLINPKEREIVAYHETGHALVAALTPGSDPVHKVTIVPRGISALGYTLQLPTEDRFLMTEKELLGKIDVLLGGRVAEQLIFNEISTGAANDLEKATEIAKRMITDYGMSDKFKNVVLISQRGPNFLGKEQFDQGRSKEYSENTQQYIDEEITKIINTRYNNVLSLLQEKIDKLKRIAKRLLATETIDAKEFALLISE